MGAFKTNEHACGLLEHKLRNLVQPNLSGLEPSHSVHIVLKTLFLHLSGCTKTEIWGRVAWMQRFKKSFHLLVIISLLNLHDTFHV